MSRQEKTATISLNFRELTALIQCIEFEQMDRMASGNRRKRSLNTLQERLEATQKELRS